jgi:hypothetical protein
MSKRPSPATVPLRYIRDVVILSLATLRWFWPWPMAMGSPESRIGE